MKNLSKIASIKVPFPVIILFFGVVVWGMIFLYLFSYESPVHEITLQTLENETINLEYGPQLSLQDEIYFDDVKEVFIDEKINFIEINLKKMTISGYRKGEVTQSFDIAAKGQDGTWSQTPAGLYKVESKSESHHSTLYDVTMPYSVQFFGNYYIHGWPYHPDGRSVSSPSSAGCIRLETESARELYDFARNGMPVLVFEEGYSRDDFAYFNSIENVTAEKYLVLDLKSDFLFTQKNSDQKLQLNDLNKLAIGLIASERVFIGTPITIPEGILKVKSYKNRFSVGEKVTLFTLLASLLTESSNEALLALIQYMGKSQTELLLKNYTHVLGMSDTVLDSSINGEDNVSTFQDLVSLSKYLYFNRMSLLEITRGKFNSIYLTPKHKDINPIHSLNEATAFIGGFITHEEENLKKTGIAIFEIVVQDKVRPVAIIVSDSEKPEEDIMKLFNSIQFNH